ncbi:MAG: thiolase family protein [Anaerolineales bacterium]|jgi:acetyl-CoA acetyltransferase family protein
MNEVFILSAVRTAVGIGKLGGALSSFSPMDLAAWVLAEAPRRAHLEPARVEDVILGCVSPIGEQGANIARLSLLKAGYPVTVPGVSLNRMCGSGQQAIHFAAQAIASGEMDVVVAGGIEVMSRVPLGSDWPSSWPSDFPYSLVHQGVSAEMIAEEWDLTRERLDDFSFESHIRAGQAIREGRFREQILPLQVPVRNPEGEPTEELRTFEQDEGVRLKPDRARMATLKTVFKPDGVVTAGNASQISDGAAALVLASSRAMHQLQIKPRARVVATAVVGSDPVLMLDGPIPATRKALARAGLSLAQLDAIEINEAFASVVLAWQKELEPDPARVNPNGGAIALGHPLGATGAILMTKLIHELERVDGRYGLQTMCIGHGMATATIIERV